ncbi:HYR-like domain-containing protein [Flavobacterium capsici]|uniref:Gliding motility-associated C-terminal domain-containing protein n=1 Tax=Flavobacterium capsici TaxID=3075618 RepID=A0AA96F4D9_9FLAO|nr:MULTISPECIES: gliding motility-associated C-terminal domain-containing protein [unclassified Flavobacterium]WNM18414.1 gliding motility-associated C-terminal domain-containing protein [Flavobacterium sp. PMR2A8]WNM22465.1 gliding motility-associated C-terminal domain-containing protein [Flavobacterium sp. PMTSA4]
MKSKITLLLLILFTTIGNLYSQFDAQHPDLRNCGVAPNYYLDVFNCNSNNFTLNNVFLSLTNVNGQPINNTTCTIGVTQQVYVMLNYTSNASNTPNNCRLFADLTIDNVVTPINAYLGSITPGAGQRLIYGPFNWTCGQELTLNRILVVWRTGGSSAQLASYNCSTYGSSQCELPGNTIITKPLAVQFTYVACKNGNNTTVSFTSTSNGGTPPYTYAWDFDNNGTTDSTLANPTFTYTTPNNTAKLTVTDSMGLTNSYTMTIIIPSEILLTETHTNVSCSGGNTGSIDLSVSGGAPGYTYLWSNGATTQDLSGLSAGTYNVTVTDSKGCQKTLSVIISGGDNTPPVVNAPANTTIEGCVTSAIATISNLPFSSSQATISNAAFTLAGASYTDASAIASFTYQDIVSGSCPTIVTRTFRVTDVCNNVGSAVQTFTIRDTTAPVIATLPATSTINCPATPSFATATATDACGNPNLSFNDVTTPGTCAGSYSVTRTWTATDACGNSSTATQTINVQDTTAPVIAALPAPSTINCPDTPSFATATATDACGSGATLTFNDVTTPGQCAGSYSVTRTWTATDACGNTSTATQTINVIDTTAPVIAALPAPSTINCPDTPSFATATATDACGSGATLTFNDVTTPGTCAGSYSVTRTWTATDACGNTSTATQTINVIDTTAPVIAQLPAESTINCPDTPSFATATATDACGSGATLTFNDVTTPGTCAGSYSVTRTWTATDACGNTSTATQTINVQDTTAPVIAALPAPSTINCPDTPSFATATATDACGSGATLTFNDVTTPGQCAGSYSVTRTWTATDACGNTSTATQTINVIDTTAPVIAALPAPSTINCPDTPSFATATATDACGSGATLTFNDVTTPGTCAGSYSVTRTWTATDACGNTSTATQTINVIDTTAPVIAQLPAESTINCPDTPSFATATATDACGSGATLTFNDVTTPGQCAGSYSVTRTWTATDACGNSSTATQTINVIDTTAPVIAQLPAESTINCPDTPSFATATATDACGSGATLTFNDVTTPGQCAGSYSVTRTWTATDACGNSSTASQTINVQDTTAPVIAALPAPSTINCPDTPSFATATATDACGSGATLTFNDITTPGTCAGSYSITRTWTATDACGNSSTASQTINVQDTTAPVIAALPALSTINCPDTPSFATATATDACGSGATLTFNDVTTPGQCAGSYSITRTWTATDACGNTSTATQTINVQDTTAPVIAALPAPSTINCPDTPSFATATATDACGSGATLTFNDVTTPGQCAGSYSVTRTWTATDACGNTSTATQTINVQDTTAPVIAALPAPSTINCPDTPSFATATATDACGSGATLTFNDVTTPGTCAGSYSVTRTWTATDACGNSSTASQTINVQDTTAPVIAALPAPSTINCPDTPSFAQATATDACGSGATLTFNDVTTPGQCAGSYSITRTWTATDACGNSSTASQTINVQDTTAPVIAALPAPSTINCPDTPSFATATATDACGSGATLTFNDITTPGTCAGSYSITRTWTATDACGNSSTASQTINVQDTTAPVIAALPAPSTINCPDTPSFATATATDACGSGATLTFNDVTTPGQCAGSYSVTRTWTATDACGNSSTASQTINVQDTTAPVIAALPAPSTINCPDTPEFAQATATDACGSDFTLTSNDVTTPGQCAGSYSITRTWTATDACGNSSTASQTINVQDTTAPVIAALPAPSTINCPDTPSFATATATDACGSGATLTFNDITTPGTCAGSYSITRTWTATDACGNSSTATQTINVIDNTAPVISTNASNIIVECDGQGNQTALNDWLLNNGGAIASDECSNITWTNNFNALSNDCSAAVTVIFTATDECLNSSSTSATFTVNDTQNPIINQLPAESTINCPATPEFAQATATDNCDDNVLLTSNDVTTPGQCAGSYSVTRTWTATDACGNTSTATQTINIQDTTAPVIAQLPAESTINCPATPEFAQATATDACGSDFTLTSNDVTTPGQCAGSYSVTRTWTATDACGNTSTATQTINVIDNTAPVIAQLPAESTINCPATPEFAQATATDACGSDFTLTSNDVTTPGQCAGSYSVTRTWTATDACGNTSTATQTINVIDNTAPVIAQLPAESTINCPATPEFAQATATDACGSDFTLTSNDVTTPGQCAGSYSVTRTWTATDACGNTSTATQTINVIDNTAPVIAQLPAESTINCPATPEFAQATATDACDSDATLTFNDVTTPGQCAGSYSVTRTWTATDACGNTSTATQIINVIDNTAPVIAQLPAESTINCPATPEFAQATATDACGSDFTLTSNDVTTPGQCAGSYSVTRTWTATDACGNTSTATQTINVIDNTAPVIAQLPAESTINCPATPEFAQATATDACGSDFTLTSNDVTTPGQCAGSYSVTRTWTATDACGNTSTATQIINVIDNTAPTFNESVPVDTTASCDNIPTIDVLTASDNCGTATVSVNEVIVQGNCPNNYQIIRTWTATDSCGNNISASQTITVQDTTGPILTSTYTEKMIVTCSTIPVAPELTFEDNCSGNVTVTFTETQNDPIGDTYTIIRTWVATDACGNQSSVYTQTINVEIVSELVDTINDTDRCNEAEEDQIDLATFVSNYPSNGTWILNNTPGIVGTIFNPLDVAAGTYTVSYEFDNGEACPKRVDINLSVISDCAVLDCQNIVIHNAFTPNGDSLNQYFSIENIEDINCYPTNKVEIYNRWGILVYETTNYDNQTRRFEGISEGRATVSKSSELPTGTYFYIIQYTTTEGNTVTKNGYLYLTR